MEDFYDRHREWYKDCLNNTQKKRTAESWMQTSTLDRWRHERMLKLIIPLIDSKSSWLTLGDGRYGTDANFILRNGGSAHATDLSDNLLKIGSKKKFIQSFSVANAENLSFEDNSFDYVLIKETLHHCPRMWLALHESFRVSRKGIILIEPCDSNTLISFFRGLMQKFRRSNKRDYGFEIIGNFVYKLNKKELEKFLLGMNYQYIAFNKVNDVYERGVEFEKLNNLSNKGKYLFLKMKIKIFIKNITNYLRIYDGSTLISALFKEPPSQKTINLLMKNGWKFKKLPSNPYKKY